MPLNKVQQINDYVNTAYDIVKLVADQIKAGTFATQEPAVSNIIELRALTPVNNLTVGVRGFHTDGDGGGGTFYYDSSQDKANHNGITIIDPDNIADLATWDASAKTTWFTAGTGTGCWMRVYSGAIDVRWAGVKGDGVTDDTAACQAFLDAGGRQIWPPGTYRITSTLTGISDTWIEGYGAVIKHDSATAEDVLYFLNKTDVTIQGIEIDGQSSLKSTGSSTGRGIHLEGVTRGTVRDCYVHDTWEHGIRLGGSFAQQNDSLYVKAINNTVIDCGNGTPNFRGFGIWCFWNVEHLIIQGNNIRDCYGGIMVDDASSDATANVECRYAAITGNTILQTALALGSTLMRGINIEGCTNISCTGNQIIGKLGYGILVNDGQGEALTENIVISSNDIDLTDTTNTVAYGIGIVDSSEVLAASNRITLSSTSTSSAGIRISSGNESSVTCKNNDVIGNKILTSMRGILVFDSTTANNYPDSIRIKQNTIINNGDLSATSAAIGIYLLEGDNCTIQGNNVDTMYTGISVSSLCSGCKILGNEAINASGNYNYSFGSPVKVERNYSAGGTTAGYRIDSGANSTSTTFAYNQAEDTTTHSGTITNVVFSMCNFPLQTYAPSNVVTDRTYDANATTTAEIADVLGTLIADLQSQGVIK